MRNTALAVYTAVPIGVTVHRSRSSESAVTLPESLPLTFAELSVTFPESPVTLGLNTQYLAVWLFVLGRAASGKLRPTLCAVLALAQLPCVTSPNQTSHSVSWSVEITVGRNRC